MGTWSWQCCKGCGAGGSGSDYDEQEAEKASHEGSCTHEPDDD